ncbi:MAG TPA: CusA/CzcA family heavy metal efflux RND transporter [Steroidobacteraceae bacterium]|nr:CusA/CzcA family heavy metal efflux RND transporter [Steroidobacteraceae bacterium]
MIDRIINASVERRWFVLVAVFGFIAFGVYQYKQLAIDAVPDITNVQVQVNARAPGYSPLEVEGRVTFPIEYVMSGLPKLDNFRSISKYGLSQTVLVFKDGTDIYFARQLVNERLQAARDQLPAGIELEMGPVATGLGEIFMYVVEAKPGALKADGTPYSATDLRTIQDWIIRPQLRQVQGVTEVDAIGGYTKQFHVQPDPAKLLAFGLSLDDLEQALRASNLNVGAGYIENNGEQQLVRVPGQLAGAEEIRHVVVATRNGVPVRVSDVAEVGIGHPLRTGAAQLGTQQTVLSTTFMLIGENSREVSIRVADKLKEIQKSLPAGVIAQPVYNRTDLVNNTVATVQKNLLEGALLVIFVLFVFLGNLRAALLTACVIPLALFATFTGMVQTGVSGNLMSLGALDFGLIIDGALIIVENCLLRLSEAQHARGGILPRAERFETVYSATREVFRPSLVSVMVIVLVNLPIFALTGVEGKMFHPMAFAVIAALVGALILSITFVPAACALLFTGHIKEGDNALVTAAKRVYRPALRFVLNLRWIVVAAALALIAVCGLIASRMGAEFIPQLDEGDIVVLVNRIPGIGIEEAVRIQRHLNAALAKHPEVERVFARTGTNDAATDPMSPGQTDTFLILKPRDQWPDPHKSKQQLLADIDRTLSKQPGGVYAFSQPIEMRFNELIAGVRADLAVKVFGDDFDELTRIGDHVGAVIFGVPNAADVTVEPLSGLPTLTVTPDRMQLGRYGLKVEDVQNAVSTAVGGSEAGTIYEGDARFDVVVRLPEQLRTDTAALERLPLMLPDGRGYVPLSEVAKVALTDGPNQISRDNGKRRVVITANVRGRDLSSFVADVQAKLDRDLKLPAGYYIQYAGTFEQLESASARLRLLVPIALLLIFGLLFTTFGSLRDAALVFSGVPLALTGGVIALLLRGIPLSITAGVGFITLCGVAVLTGVVMVSAIRDLIRDGVQPEEAIVQGAILRLRPILMIGLVASLGFLPMALNTSTGAEVQRPLATVVIGGIVSATLLSLFVLPALYRLTLPRHEKAHASLRVAEVAE